MIERALNKVKVIVKAAEEEYKIKLPEGSEFFFVLSVLQNPHMMRNLMFKII